MQLTARKKALIAFTAAAALLTGCESSADIERKPAVAAAMLDQSLARCDLQGDTAQNYRHRLREVFMDAYTDALETLKNAGVTVCLDRRFTRPGFYGSSFGTYYGEPKVLTIADSGRDKNDARALSLDATDVGAAVIHSLDYNIKEHTTTKFMSAHTTNCGKNCFRTSLIPANQKDNFWTNTYKISPSIITAPVIR